jgi:cobalt-zinc-cadmium efflux system outer membrane protein
MAEDRRANVPSDPDARPVRWGPCAPEKGAYEQPPLPPAVGPSAALPAVVSLPEAIHETVFFNLRVRAGTEKIQQARADLLSSSLVPNPQLTLDSLLNPLTHPFTVDRQGGPPQMDVAVSFPIDWFLFGKRLAAMESSRLGVDVAAADFADLIRQQVVATLTAFYDVLEAKELLRLADEDLESLKRVEAITKDKLEAGGAAAVDLDRARLAVLDSQREQRRRDAALVAAKSKLRPLLGRVTLDPSFDVKGVLDVAAAAAVPELTAALEAAEKQRPDIISRVRQVAKAEADIRKEQTQAFPQVSLQPGFTRQFQEKAIGFPDASSYGITLTTTLPITDRNQGNIDKARSSLQEALATLQADLADLRAEVEQALDAYRVALAIVTADDPATIETARRVRDSTEKAYKAGGRSLVEVLDAERAYRDRVRAAASGKADYWRALHKLNAALGGRTLETADVPRTDAPPER